MSVILKLQKIDSFYNLGIFSLPECRNFDVHSNLGVNPAKRTTKICPNHIFPAHFTFLNLQIIFYFQSL